MDPRGHKKKARRQVRRAALENAENDGGGECVAHPQNVCAEFVDLVEFVARVFIFKSKVMILQWVMKG